MQQHNLRSQIERLKRPIRFSSLNQRAGEDSSLEELPMQAVGTVALMLASEVIDGDLSEEEIRNKRYSKQLRRHYGRETNTNTTSGKKFRPAVPSVQKLTGKEFLTFANTLILSVRHVPFHNNVYLHRLQLRENLAASCRQNGFDRRDVWLKVQRKT